MKLTDDQFRILVAKNGLTIDGRDYIRKSSHMHYWQAFIDTNEDAGDFITSYIDQGTGRKIFNVLQPKTETYVENCNNTSTAR